MISTTYKPFGKLLKTHGTNGEFVLLSLQPLTKDFFESELVFLPLEGGEPVPFFFTSIRPKSDSSALVKFDGINSLEQSQEYVGIEVLIKNTENLDKTKLGKSNSNPSNDLIGFTVVDQTTGFNGTIDEVIDIPGNLLLRVISGKNEVLIPFHEDFIRSVDPKKRSILFELPEGLIDLNV